MQGSPAPGSQGRDRTARARREWILAAGGLAMAALVALGQWLAARPGAGELRAGWALLAGLAAWGLLKAVSAADDARAAAERVRDVAEQERGAAFSQKIGQADSWDALVGEIVRSSHAIAPAAQVTLYVYHTGAVQLAPEAICARDGTVTLRPPLSISPDSLPVGSLPQLLLQQMPDGMPHSTLPPHRYDLPVTRDGQVLAVIKLEYPPDGAPAPAEVRALHAAAPVIALALEVRLLQDLAERRAADSIEERQRIAHTLHDTLAQNVGYLRLKLDQLTGENAIGEIGQVLQELERMRAAADEAYEQVRQTLDDLTAPPPGDLYGLLIPQAQAICQRAGLRLVVHENGAPFALSAHARQHVYYITREALHNVEKHAQATQVTLTYLWEPGGLVFKISDDGRGFDPRQVDSAPGGHYGLWIMQRRAAELGGTLRLRAQAGEGAEVTLWLPRGPQAARPEAGKDGSCAS